VKASALEFRLRFLIIAAIFCAAFTIARSSHQSLWITLSSWMSRLDRASTGANSLAIGIVASACVIIGALLRTWASAYVSSAIVHDRELHTHSLIAAGPYCYLRNPLYLGTILLAIGNAPILSGWGALILVAAICLFSVRLMLREEAELVAAQGAMYEAYRSSVPSLLPRWRPMPRGTTSAGVDAKSLASAAPRPRWGQAILGELWFWGFAAAVVLYAFTFRFDWYLRALVAGFGCYLIARGVQRK
jgi:protein-S-isoprenylcysteine O-methyltransferase Ste14